MSDDARTRDYGVGSRLGHLADLELVEAGGKLATGLGKGMGHRARRWRGFRKGHSPLCRMVLVGSRFPVDVFRGHLVCIAVLVAWNYVGLWRAD